MCVRSSTIQRAKSEKFEDGYLIFFGQLVKDYVVSAMKRVFLRYCILNIKVKQKQAKLSPKPPAVKRFHSSCVVPSDIDSDCHFSTDPKPYLSTPCKGHPKPISELIIPEYSCLFLVAGHCPNSRDFNEDCVDGRKSFVSKCNSMLRVLSREDSLKSGDHCASLFQ